MITSGNKSKDLKQCLEYGECTVLDNDDDNIKFSNHYML